MATQEYIDDLIIVIETAEDAESVTNQMVAAVLGFLNEHLKLVSQGKEIEAEEAARIAARCSLAEGYRRRFSTYRPACRQQRFAGNRQL